MNTIVVRILLCLLFGMLLLQCRQEPLTSPKQDEPRPSSPANPDTARFGGDIPRFFELAQPYPNPFNGSTTMTAAIPQESFILLVVQNPVGDVLNVLVAETLEAGYYSITWDGTNSQGKLLKEGYYFISMQAGSFLQSRLVKLER